MDDYHFLILYKDHKKCGINLVLVIFLPPTICGLSFNLGCRYDGALS